MIQESRKLESRIEGLIASWNVNCPYTISLKLVLDEWNNSLLYDDTAETKNKSCFTTPRKNKSQVRFSYETNSDGLPSTNLRGRCRPFLAPKTLSFQSPQREVAYRDIERISSHSPIVGTKTYQGTAGSSIVEKTFPEKTTPRIAIVSQNQAPIPTHVQLTEGSLQTSACVKSIADTEIQKQLEDTLFTQNQSKCENNQVSKNISSNGCNTVKANASPLVNTQDESKIITNVTNKPLKSSGGIDNCYKKKRRKTFRKDSPTKSSEYARKVTDCKVVRKDVDKDIVNADKYND